MSQLVESDHKVLELTEFGHAYRIADDFVNPDDYPHDASAVDRYDFRRWEIAHKVEGYYAAGARFGKLLVLSEIEATTKSWAGDKE